MAAGAASGRQRVPYGMDAPTARPAPGRDSMTPEPEAPQEDPDVMTPTEEDEWKILDQQRASRQSQ